MSKFSTEKAGSSKNSLAEIPKPFANKITVFRLIPVVLLCKILLIVGKG